MATVKIALHPRAAIPASSNGAQHKVVDGTNFPVPSLAFDASTEESVFFTFRAASYGSGNLTLTLNWYADTASSGDVVFGAAIAAITPNTESQNIETKAFATAQTVTDSRIGATGKRLHECAITISNLDSIAANDWVVLKLYRAAADAGDTMTSDALVTMAELSYSDT